MANKIEEIKGLLDELKDENSKRSKRMNSGTCTEYEHTVLVHKHNAVLDVIKRLEKKLDD